MKIRQLHSGTLTTKIDESVRKMHNTRIHFLWVAVTSNGHTSIRREYKNFYHFVKGGNNGLNNIRRETMFINILEGLHPLEAEIICLVKIRNFLINIRLRKNLFLKHILIFNGEVVLESYENSV